MTRRSQESCLPPDGENISGQVKSDQATHEVMSNQIQLDQITTQARPEECCDGRDDVSYPREGKVGFSTTSCQVKSLSQVKAQSASQ